MKPRLLILFPLAQEHLAAIRESCEVHHAPTDAARAAAMAQQGAGAAVVLTTGNAGLTAAEMNAMPQLELVCAFGAGYEGIDVAHARKNAIVVSHAPGANDSSVADHALALLLSLVRNVPALDKACRQGLWRDDLPLPASLAKKKMGIVGLGQIGGKIASRAAGFEMEVGYRNRHPRSETGLRHFPDLLSMARWCDFLILSAPGGPDTHHMIDTQVLAALGPQGYLVNVGRGSLVDTAALAAALRAGAIAGAALDVYEGEPAVPQALCSLPNVLLTPHIAGSCPEAMRACVNLFIDNVHRHFSGQPVRTPVP